MVSAAGDGGAKSPNHWSRPMFSDTFLRPEITSSREINLDYPFKREKVAKTAILETLNAAEPLRFPREYSRVWIIQKGVWTSRNLKIS